MLQALADEGYETPTPIQAQAIPALLNGSDLLGIAQTGTGKTAAFALPLLTRIAADRRPAPRRGARVLILAPTRELAAQIGESFRTYGRHLGVTVAVVFGGVAHKPQINALSKGVDILVATPGRLIDHLDTRVVTLDAVEALVLDEADQMLDLGFVRPIRRIVSKLPAVRQNLFFSATMPHEIAALAAELLTDPVRVQVTPVATTAERVKQRVIHIEANNKRTLLVDLLAAPEMHRTLVFTRTKRGADRVAGHLEDAGITASAIHGNKSQRQREVALEAFRNAKIKVLVATDIAARGIDIDGVTHVVNYELPEVPEAYVHRIGRTARAGAEGDAISLCDVEERDLLRGIERLTRQSIPSEDRRNDPTIAAVTTRAPSSRGDEDRGHRRDEQRPHRGRPEHRKGDREHDSRRKAANGRSFGRPQLGDEPRERNRDEAHAPRARRDGEGHKSRNRPDQELHQSGQRRDGSGFGAKRHERGEGDAADGRRHQRRDGSGFGAKRHERGEGDAADGRRHQHRDGSGFGGKRHERGDAAATDGHRQQRRDGSGFGAKRHERGEGAATEGHRHQRRDGSGFGAKRHERGDAAATDGHRQQRRDGSGFGGKRHERGDTVATDDRRNRRHDGAAPGASRQHHKNRDERPSRPDGEAVAHVFANGKGSGKPWRGNRDAKTEGKQGPRGERKGHGRDGGRRDGGPSPHSGAPGRLRRGNGGKGHRGANAGGRRLVDA